MWPTSLTLPSASSTRCKGCDHPRPKYNGAYGSVRSSLGAMLSNAQAGCVPCSIFSDGILRFLTDNCEISRDDVNELRIDFNLTGNGPSLELMLLNTPIKLCFFCSEPTPWLSETLPDLPVGYEIPRATSSTETLSWAVHQLQHCKQFHKSCSSTSAKSPLPTRVLDVFAWDSAEGGVRLYESRSETAPYASLSHCWGKKPFLRTLSFSLAAHKNEIIWARLPPSFQDAISFTRKLGIRYLWIDSLCIVQDDTHDWRLEAANMASIYQNSAIVISAAKSQGAYGGLYAEFPSKHKTHTIIVSPDPNTASETIHVRHALTHSQRLLSPYHAPPSTLPIFTRGWILQERFLSPRTLHFGPEELSWECVERTACQCSGPNISSSSSSSSSSSTHLSSSTPAPQPQPTTSKPPRWYTHLTSRCARPKHYYSPTTWHNMTPDELAACWRRLVEDYTRLRLTYDKDVFPAVAGMAQAMFLVRNKPQTQPDSTGPGAQEQYLAGLWRSSLLPDLLWHVELPPSTSTNPTDSEGNESCSWEWPSRPEKWRAPSWSWAAVKAPVEFLNTTEPAGFKAECEVVDVKCEPAGPDPRGELLEGGSYLILKGRLVPAVLRRRRPRVPPAAGPNNGNRPPEPWNLLDLDIMNGHMKNIWADDGCEDLLGHDELNSVRVYCLLIGRKLPSKEPVFLLLARVKDSSLNKLNDSGSDQEPLTYRRIGLLEVLGGPPSPVSWGWLHNLRDKGEDAVVRMI